MSRTGPHSRCPGPALDTKQIESFWKRRRIVSGQIGETLQSGGFHNGRTVIEKGPKGGSGAAGFWQGQGKAREQERQVPAQLLEPGVGQETQKRLLIFDYNFSQGGRGMLCEAFKDVGRATGHARIVIPQQLHQPGGPLRVPVDQFSHLWNAAAIERMPADG